MHNYRSVIPAAAKTEQNEDSTISQHAWAEPNNLLVGMDDSFCKNDSPAISVSADILLIKNAPIALANSDETDACDKKTRKRQAESEPEVPKKKYRITVNGSVQWFSKQDFKY
ncbi:hypothetical protein TSAR_015282 [Trichomalopsis sarcophagae]|uniref:Uncharacterized protein n=1 Tax=Trichomalopsis sarcophagae TaxID=543379 RepID=A0A232EIM2_9HYME|nr:hypothetical protein TSAR_015282 [Trichomalopsis sarcophagae]